MARPPLRKELPKVKRYVPVKLSTPTVAEQQAQDAAHEALDDGFAGHAGDDADAEEGQRKVLRGLEVQGHLGQMRGAEHQYHAAEQCHRTGTRRWIYPAHCPGCRI